METRTASQWMMQDSSVSVVINIYSRAQVRSESGISRHQLEGALKDNPWGRREGNRILPTVLSLCHNLDGSYEATLPGLKPSQLYAFHQYMTAICKKLIALGDWNIERIVFRLNIKTGSVSVSAEE